MVVVLIFGYSSSNLVRKSSKACLPTGSHQWWKMCIVTTSGDVVIGVDSVGLVTVDVTVFSTTSFGLRKYVPAPL